MHAYCLLLSVKGDLAHFFVVVEEEGLFFMGSSSIIGLFASGTTRVFLAVVVLNQTLGSTNRP